MRHHSAVLAVAACADAFAVTRARPPRRAATRLAASIVPPPDSPRNTYWCVRHGQSTANVANIISSDPVVGSTQHELTALGQDQARAAGASLWDALAARDGAPNLDRVALYSSNFTRARETSHLVAFELQRRAQLAGGSFDAPPLVRVGLLGGLRERDFGALDGLNTGAYDAVWPRDLADAWDGTDGVEAVGAVCARLRAMVDLLEERHAGEDVVLTAHADVIQIFQTWFAAADVRGFSRYRFANGEVRECDRAGANLPVAAEMRSQKGVAA